MESERAALLFQEKSRIMTYEGSKNLFNRAGRTIFGGALRYSFRAIAPFEAMNPGYRQSERSKESIDCVDFAAGHDGHRAAGRLEEGFKRAPCALFNDNGFRRLCQLCKSAVKIEKESVGASFAQE